MNKYHVWSPDLDQVNGIDIDAETPRQAAVVSLRACFTAENMGENNETGE